MGFNDNWDGVKRNDLNEKLVGKQHKLDFNKDGKLSKTDFDILKGIRKDAEKKKDKKESVKEVEEATNQAPRLPHFTDLKDFAANVRKTAMTVKSSDMKNYLLQVSGSLAHAGQQQAYFFEGLISSLEDIRRKTMSPSKHGNMEILKDLEMVIKELKKY